MPYPEEMVAPMRAEMVQMGVTELRTASDVDQAMADTSGTSLYFVNSVCGCAAGSARPGLGVALRDSTAKPDRLYTVFAGQDGEATEAVRQRIVGFPPSSPSIAMFKDGELVAMVERHHIQGRSADELGEALTGTFTKFCAPSPA